MPGLLLLCCACRLRSCTPLPAPPLTPLTARAPAAAARPLPQRLFKNDRVPHGWMAVSRYEEIEADFASTYKEGEAALRTAILINCGAAEDVRELLRLEERPNVRVVIVDSHRWVGGAPLAPLRAGAAQGAALPLQGGGQLLCASCRPAADARPAAATAAAAPQAGVPPEQPGQRGGQRDCVPG